MGEVYRAHDPRTGRDVAIKISAECFSDRFSHEVRAVAALNHPNICHLYDVGPDYLVMELVEGPTLSERIKRGALQASSYCGSLHKCVPRVRQRRPSTENQSIAPGPSPGLAFPCSNIYKHTIGSRPGRSASDAFWDYVRSTPTTSPACS
jgi:hypothetical protein